MSITTTSFFDVSKAIADKFIQSILFIDDEIYPAEEGLNNLDGQALVKAFSKAKKLCALNNPKAEEDFEDLIEVAKLSDVTILDWKINLEQNEDVAEDHEEEEIEIRGGYTLKLIKSILYDRASELKLILIYSGEIALPSIVEKLHQELKGYGITKIEDDLGNKLANSNLKIVVIAKPSLKGRFTHTPLLNNWVVEYEDLPELILTEFTKLTEGLISNMALSSITCIRNNSFRLLNTFNKSVDPAFLFHRALLPVMDDAGEIIKDSLISSIKSILEYGNITQVCDYTNIDKWIASKEFPNHDISIGKKNLLLSKNEIKLWQREGFLNSLMCIWKSQHPEDSTPEESRVDKLEKIFKRLHKEPVNYFLPNEYDCAQVDENFSILTHHKSNHANKSYIPRLTLGTVIKGSKTGNYWLCIQQKCDSVRLDSNEVRRFMFLPLRQVDEGKNFHFIISCEGNILRFVLDNKTYKLRTIKFKANKNGAVFSRKFGVSNKDFFVPYYNSSHPKYDENKDENYIWVLDLKDFHAQRIVHDYASELSRIGLDESEWLRRWAGN